MKPKLLLSFLFILCTFVLAGCSPDLNDAYIQGTWEYESKHLQNITGEQHLISSWSFHEGSFIFTACCFNIDTYQTGRYRIIQSSEDKILLELFDVKGDDFLLGDELLIRIDRQNSTLSIGGTSPFKFVSP